MEKDIGYIIVSLWLFAFRFAVTAAAAFLVLLIISAIGHGIYSLRKHRRKSKK